MADDSRYETHYIILFDFTNALMKCASKCKILQPSMIAFIFFTCFVFMFAAATVVVFLYLPEYQYILIAVDHHFEVNIRFSRT